MLAINIRGTGGSGKSTLVKKVMDLYPNWAKIVEEKRRRPLSTAHWFSEADAAAKGFKVRPLGLLVPGHYETACGGCDTIKTVDKVYELVRAATFGDGNNCLYEGIMVMDDVTRAVKLDQDLKKAGGHHGWGLYVIALTTPIDECIASIKKRREEQGNEKPLSEKNTRDRAKRQENILHRLKQAEVRVEKLSRDAAFERVKELLGVK